MSSTPPTSADSLQQVFVPHIGWMTFEAGDEVAEILYRGHFEAAEQACLWLYLRPGDRALDCGAHVGLYSRLLAQRVGETGRVDAFEPDPDGRRLWQTNFADAAPGALPTLHPFGLWEADQNLPFAREAHGMSSHNAVLLPAEESSAPAAAGEVPVRALDQMPEICDGGPWHFMKIDCEGAEPRILRGAAALLRSGLVSLLMIEFNEHNLRRVNSSTRELWEQVEGLGYTLHRFSPETLQLVPAVCQGEIWYENLFACRQTDAINARLRTADAKHSAVANDLIQRARACDRFKELEELNYYKEKAGLVASHEDWALRTEAALAGSKAALQNSTVRLQEAGRRIEQLNAELVACTQSRVAAVQETQDTTERLEALHQETWNKLAATEQRLQKTVQALKAQREQRREAQAQLETIRSNRLVRAITRPKRT